MPGRVRLLHILTTLDVGGAEGHVLSLLRRLPRDRFDVTVAWLKGPGELAPRFEAAGMRTVDLRLRPDLGVFRRALGLTRSIKPHVVHTHLMKADAVGAAAARLAGVPALVSTKHNEDVYLRFPPFALAAAGTARLADRVVVISDAVGRFFRRTIRLPERTTRRIYYGYEADRELPRADGRERAELRRELGMPSHAKLITTVARLTRQKGLGDLLRAARHVSESVPEVRFAIVGRGELRPRLELQVESLGLRDFVRLVGFRTDVDRILAGSDMLALPSRWEGFGMVLVEAMTAGLPVVGTRAGAIPEVVAEGETGMLVPPRDSESLATALITLLRDPETAKRMGAAGRQRVRTRFGIDREVREHVELYEEVLS